MSYKKQNEAIYKNEKIVPKQQTVLSLTWLFNNTFTFEFVSIEMISKMMSMLLLVCLSFSCVHGLYFYVTKEQRCFFFDIPNETHIRGIYTSVDTAEHKVRQE